MSVNDSCENSIVHQNRVTVTLVFWNREIYDKTSNTLYLLAPTPEYLN